MHWVDIAVIVIVALSIIIGLFRGLIKEAISLATWIVAIWIGLVFSDRLVGLMPFSVGSGTVDSLIAFVILFVIVLILGGIINYMAGHLVDKTGLSGTDRMLGLVFGLMRGVLIIAALVLLASLTNMPNEAWWQKSLTLPYFGEISAWLKEFLPEAMAKKFN